MKNAIGGLLAMMMLVSTGLGQSAPNKGPVEGFPRIVARMKLTGQTEALQPRVIFTPKSSGLFSVTIDMVITAQKQGGGASYWDGYLQWTGVVGENTQLTSLNAHLLGSQGGGRSFAFSAMGGRPVKFMTTVTGDVSGSAYDVFLVVERVTKIPSF